MYLSRLEIHGFKSFADRTALLFDPGVTAIVGPNGCGKSNIVDAVRWVIGEQRARILRSEKMENVIFNGTSKKRPLGMAEVLLTIENTRGVLPIEYAEVTLGRRLFRSGESEYLLNGVKCRLQDILDLFMDTGMGAGAYSVIELKMVEEILSENAQDRRRLFEEAAGITKYKLRRRQALGKLEETRGDLTRLNDLTEVIGKQVRSLKRQAERAEKYREYESRLQELELALAQTDYDRLDEQQRGLRREIETLQAQSTAAGKRLADEEARLEHLRADLTLREQTLNERRRRLGAHRDTVRSLESDLRLEGERLDAYRRDLDRIERERVEAGARKTALEETTARLTRELEASEPRLQETGEALQASQEARDTARSTAEAEQERVRELRRRAEAAEQESNASRRSLDRLTNRLDLLEQDRARQERLADESAEGLDQLNARAALAAREMEESGIRREAARAALESVTAQRQEIDAALETSRQSLRELERRHDALLAELNLLESLVSSYEEFSDAVQYLAATPGWSASGLQTVADVLTCDADVQLALEAALGEYASCIVVGSETEARQGLSLLRAEERGQAAFIILDRLRAVDAPPIPRAGAAHALPLLDLVRVADPALSPLSALLLRNDYLVDTIDEAREAAAALPGGRFIARSGEWADARGFLKGGSHAAEPSPLTNRMSRREQRDATRQLLAELKAELDAASTAVQRFQAERAAVPLEAARKAAVEAAEAHTQAERSHERAVFERDGL
ncbi:MAG TPA: chromosome segregation protein SMC, partial [Rhodothermales bacterium]|nr:chromosome segregation protein SMC [Rhodothermales bacterium]